MMKSSDHSDSSVIRTCLQCKTKFETHVSQIGDDNMITCPECGFSFNHELGDFTRVLKECQVEGLNDQRLSARENPPALWHAVVFNNDEISAAELLSLHQKFISLYHDCCAPKGMALLVDKMPQVIPKGANFKFAIYFSSGCLPHASRLVSEYCGIVCQEPDLSDKELLAGDIRVMGLQ
jgi:predicted nucleic acid-binding Zn ribbon protein